MAAPNKIELVVEANTSQANQNLNSVNETLKGTERQTVQSSLNMVGAIDKLTSSMERLIALREQTNNKVNEHQNALSHEVSAVQATSGALRVLEGNFTQNIRAAERFIATTVGLGDLLQKIFPIVGGIAFLGLLDELWKRAQKVVEWFKQIADVPNHLRAAFAQVNEVIRTQNDQLEVTNIKLENQIAKISGKPQNGLKLALAEAQLASDRLTESLMRSNQEALKLLQDKENTIGGFAGTVLRKESTGPVAGEQKAFNDRIQGILRNYSTQFLDQQVNGGTAEQSRQTQDRERNELTKAYREELAKVNLTLMDQYELKRKFDDYNRNELARMNLTGAARSKVESRPLDPGGVITGLEGRRANLTEQLRSMQLTGDNQILTQKSEALNVNKGQIEQIRAFQNEAEKLLIDSQVGYKNGDTALAHISEMMERGRQQGLMTPLASRTLFQALQNVVSGVPRYAANTGGTIYTAGINPNGDMFGIAAADQTQRRVYGGLVGQSVGKYLQSQNPDRADAQEAKKAFDANLKYQDQVLEAAMQAIDKQYDYQLEKLDESKTLQMKQVEEVNAQTVQQKLWVEQRKYEIEKDYVDKSTDLQISKLNTEAERQRLAAMTAAQHAISQGADSDLVNAGLSDQLSDISDATDLAAASLRGKHNTQLQEAASAAARAQTQVVQTEYKKVYDSILSETDHFLDAVTGKTKNAWKSLADELKNLFLKPLKQMIEAPIAQYLTQMITGIQGNGQMGKAGGQIFNRGGAAGAAPLAGLGALFGAGGFGGSGGVSYAGAPGGTPGFAGPVMSGGAPMMMGNNFSGGGGGGGLLARLFGGGSGGGNFGGYAPSAPAGLSAGDLANLGDFNGSELGKMASGGTPWSEAPNLGMDHVAMGMPGGSTTGGGGLGGMLSGLFGGQGGKMANAAGALSGAMMLISGLGQKGVGGAVNTIGGGAMAGMSLARMAGASGPWGAGAGAGLGLFANGIARHGAAGFGETLGGGILAGASIGSIVPGLGTLVGAGIGAAAGLIGGLVSLFTKSPREKVIQAVQSAYHVKISNSLADQIVKIADSDFGSNYAFAVSSPQVRELVSLWSASTGQFNASISPKMSAYTVSASGSSLTNLASTTYGYSNASLYGGAISSSNNGAPMPQISLQLNGEATTALLQGQVAATAPAAISASYQSSAMRQSSAAALFSPGLVTR